MRTTKKASNHSDRCAACGHLAGEHRGKKGCIHESGKRVCPCGRFVAAEPGAEVAHA